MEQSAGGLLPNPTILVSGLYQIYGGGNIWFGDKSFLFMKVELKNFHVLISDHDVFNEDFCNVHAVYFNPVEHVINWEYFLAECSYASPRHAMLRRATAPTKARPTPGE